MVNHHDRLNRTFWALVDPTRRAMLAQLAPAAALETLAEQADLARDAGQRGAEELAQLLKELASARELGVSMFAAEAEEGRRDEVLRDAFLAADAMPFLRRTTTACSRSPLAS